MRRSVPVTEWAMAALGALLVFGAIAYLAYQALGRDETPPDVRLVTERVHALEQGFVVLFLARNHGAQAAAQVVIEGELSGPEGPVETGEATLDYLPPRSEREGGLFFSRDPRAFELRLRARGYAKP